MSERDGKKKARTARLVWANLTSASSRRDSVGADFQSVRKPTSYNCAKPLVLLAWW